MTWLQQEEFARAVAALPLVSVDLLVVNPGGQLLLGQRRNAPARAWWFTPGGRVRKNEPFASLKPPRKPQPAGSREFQPTEFLREENQIQ